MEDLTPEAYRHYWPQFQDASDTAGRMSVDVMVDNKPTEGAPIAEVGTDPQGQN